MRYLINGVLICWWSFVVGLLAKVLSFWFLLGWNLL